MRKRVKHAKHSCQLLHYTRLTHTHTQETKADVHRVVCADETLELNKTDYTVKEHRPE